MTPFALPFMKLCSWYLLLLTGAIKFLLRVTQEVFSRARSGKLVQCLYHKPTLPSLNILAKCTTLQIAVLVTKIKAFQE